MPKIPFESASFTERLEQLLLQKSFAQLTPSEQVWVLQQMTQETYEAQHHLLVQGKYMFHKQRPQKALPPDLKQNLMKVAKKNTQSTEVIHNLFHISTNIFSFLQKMLTHRIPSWQPTLLIMGILLAWNFIEKNEINSTKKYPSIIQAKLSTPTEMVYLCTTDTLIVEKIVDKVHLVEIEIPVYVDKYVENHATTHNEQTGLRNTVENLQNLTKQTPILNEKTALHMDKTSLSTFIDQQSDQNWIVNGGKINIHLQEATVQNTDKTKSAGRSLQQDRIFSQFFTKAR